MLQPFEDAVFAAQEGDLGGPVKTEVGYHIYKIMEHVPAYVQPLKVVYSIVASDLARAKADTIAQRRADSLLRVVHTVAQARAAGAKLKLGSFQYVLGEDEPVDNEALRPYFDRLKRMKANELMPVKWASRGEGYWITWLDSISAAAPPTWEVARERAVLAYRAGGGERAMLAKTAELDSMLASGWTLDSLAALWGGLQRSKELVASGVKESESLPVALDSLVFGYKGAPPPLEKGEVSNWVRWPGGARASHARLFRGPEEALAGPDPRPFPGGDPAPRAARRGLSDGPRPPPGGPHVRGPAGRCPWGPFRRPLRHGVAPAGTCRAGRATSADHRLRLAGRRPPLGSLPPAGG
jgi:hypothetical protein